MPELRNKAANVIFIVLLLLSFGILLLFMVTAFPIGNKLGKDLNLYSSTTEAVLESFKTEVTPIWWCHVIWLIIFLWQALWIFYLVTCLCRQGGCGYYLYYCPNVFPVPFMLVYILSLGCNIGWLLTWDRGMLVVSAILIVLTAVTLYVCLVIVYIAMYDQAPIILDYDLMGHAWWIRLFLHNGLGVYAGWTTVLMMVNIAITIINTNGVTVYNASLLCLIVLAVLALVYFSFDLFMLDRWARYTITPYMAFIFGIVTIICNPANILDRKRMTNYYLAIGILAMASVLLFVKCVLLLVRHNTMPHMFVKPGVPVGKSVVLY